MSNLLLAMDDQDRPYAILNYASKVATSLGATLHILQMLPPLGDRSLVERPRMADARVRRDVDRCIAACRQTRTWHQKVLGTSLPTQRLRIRVGELANEVARHATELDAVLVVLAATTSRLGPTTTALVRACERPVLVARGAAPSGPIVAAADPHHDPHRVVRYCQELGARLKASVVTVHLDGASLEPGAPFRPVAELAWTEARSTDARYRPRSSSRTVSERIDALLGQVARYRSRLIVLSEDEPGAGPSLEDDGLAAQLVERAGCSVLVTSPAATESRALRSGSFP